MEFTAKNGHCNEAEVKKYLRLSKQEYNLVSKRGPGVDAACVSQTGNYDFYGLRLVNDLSWNWHLKHYIRG